MNSTIKTVIFWIVIILSATVLWRVVKSSDTSSQSSPEVSYSQFLSQVEAGNVVRIKVSGIRADGIYRDGSLFHVILPASQEQTLTAMRQKGIEIWYVDTTKDPVNWIANLAPLVLLAALWFYMIRRIRKTNNPQPAGTFVMSSGSTVPK